MGDQWRFWISLPLFTAAASTFVPLLVPTFRWGRALHRDLQIWKDLPDGTEKVALGKWVDFQARRMREYRTVLPWYWKAAAWGVASATAAAIVSALLFGAPTLFGPEVYWPDWILVILVLMDLVWAIPVAFAGRPIAGWAPGYDAEWRARQTEKDPKARTSVGGF